MRTEPTQINNFIDGTFVAPISGRYLDNIEPATGKPYSQVADSNAVDVGATPRNVRDVRAPIPLTVATRM